MPFLETQSFDTILCTDVIEHIKKPEILFSEMSRILKEGGYLILGVPFMYWIHDDEHDYYRYTRHVLKSLCEENNLKIVELTSYGGAPEIIYDIVIKSFSHCNFRGGRIFIPLWRGTGRLLSRLKFVKKISCKTRDVFPLGYLLVAQKNLF